MEDSVYSDIVKFLAKKPSLKELIAFHTTYKYFIYSKSHKAYKSLGAIVANPNKEPIEVILKKYESAFLEAISIEGSVSNIHNVLLHIFGYFKKLMSKKEKEEVLSLIQEYKEERIPLKTIVNKINFYTNKYDVKYLKTQKFLEIFK